MIDKIIKEIDYNKILLIFFLLSFLLACYNLSMPQILIGILIGWIVSGIGISVVLHRYVAHKTFEFKNNFYKLVSYIIAFLTGLGNPVIWALIHHQHHAITDKIGDPQSPLQIGKFKTFFSIFKVPSNDRTNKQKEILVRDPYNKFISKYFKQLTIFYFLILYFLFGSTMFLIFAGIVIPFSICYQGYVNAFLHAEPECDGVFSKNIKGGLFWFGENLHRDHHLTPNRAWYTEYDLGKYYIKLVGNNYNEKI